MTDLAFLPSSVPAVTAARRRSPVARWQTQYSSTIDGDCVPLPQPGGPTKMIRLSGFTAQVARRLISAAKASVDTFERSMVGVRCVHCGCKRMQ